MPKYISNYENIRETKKKMLATIDELYKELAVIESKIEQSKVAFDTPMANKFRIKSTELLKREKQIMDDTLVPYINSLDEVSLIYEQLYNEVKASIQGE